MKTKICSKCKEEKNICDFYKNKNNKDNYETICKICKKEYYIKNKNKILNRTHSYYEKKSENIKKYKKEYRKNNSDKIKIKRKQYYEDNKENIIKKQCEYYLKNKEKLNENRKKYRELNRNKINEANRIYAIKNKEKRRKHQKERYKNDYMYRFTVNIRNRINEYIGGKGKNEHTREIIGCDYKYLTEHLLQTYKNNYGIKWDKKEKVHIDHIIRLATAKNKNDIIKLNHYSNLQLLKEKDNLKKGTKLDWKL